MKFIQLPKRIELQEICPPPVILFHSLNVVTVIIMRMRLTLMKVSRL